MTPNNIFMIWFFCLVAVVLLASGTNAAGGGSWAVVQPSIGISAMHMQLLPTDRVVMFDRTDFGASNLSLPAGKCRSNPPDCTAHSIEYDVLANTFRPLMVQTNVWCSSGALMPDGRLIQTGGFQDGEHVVRVYKSCDTCDWREVQSGLTQKRWYATNHLLPGGRQIIIGGRRQFNYEFYPKTAAADKSYSLPFLVQTNDPQIENNLYPFVFLNVDGNLFVFANNRAILFDYSQNAVLKTYPQIPGGDPRSYPSTGSAVLLPLKNIQSPQVEAEVLVCGGAPKGSYTNSLNGKFDGALNTCARIKVTDPSPQWVVETMPLARVMGDMLLLPTGDVLIINGASAGAAGWEQGRNPVLSPVLYQPDNTVGARFEVQNPTTIPRMYHSTAGLLRDGRVLVAGSNPHAFYNFTGVLYPTELSLEAFSPKYLDSTSDNLRPKIISPRSRSKLKYGQQFNVRFSVAASGTPDASSISVTMVSPAFNTHSFSMNQRLLVVSGGDAIKKGTSGGYDVRVTMPSSANFAPPGYYMLFVVHQGVPSQGAILTGQTAFFGSEIWRHELRPVTVVRLVESFPNWYHNRDSGRVLVAGSNPHAFYNFTGVLYPTELSLEAFSPKYLDSTSDNLRPQIISPRSRSKLKYGQQFNVRFSIAASGTPDASSISVTMVSPAFNTHSSSMNQRLLVVSGGDTIKKGKSGGYDVRVTMPSSANFAPPGYYMLFVVYQGVPSRGIWIHIN